MTRNHIGAAVDTVLCALTGLMLSVGTANADGGGPGPAYVTNICPASARPVTDYPDYGSRVLRAIGKRTFYPEVARFLGESGQVVVCVKMDAQAGAVQALVDRSSGFPLLDGAALYAVGRAAVDGQIPPPPPSVAPQSLAVPGGWVKLPIRFALSGDEAPAVPAGPAGDATQQREFIQHFTTESKGNILYFNMKSRSCQLVNGASWIAELEGQITGRMRDPRGSASSNLQGTALLGAEFDRDGHLLRAALVESSGDPRFDGIALMALASTFVDPRLPKLRATGCPSSSTFLTSIPVVITGPL